MAGLRGEESRFDWVAATTTENICMTPLELSSKTESTIAPSRSQARLILVGAALLLILGMGIRQSFGLFVEPVTRDLAVTVADFTLALAIQNIVWGLSQAPVGAIADRFGLRIPMLAGAAIYVSRPRRHGYCAG